jgi:hypothetical protein
MSEMADLTTVTAGKYGDSPKFGNGFLYVQTAPEADFLNNNATRAPPLSFSSEEGHSD